MKLTNNDIIEYWLLKFHGLTVKELMEKEPELVKSPTWFQNYPVTQEQHDDWVQWAIKSISKDQKLSKKYVSRNWQLIYLDTAPTVKT